MFNKLFTKVLILAAVINFSAGQVIALSPPEPVIQGKITIDTGPSGYEALEITAIEQSDDRIYFYNPISSHRFEIFKNDVPLAPNHEAKFELTRFGNYVCSGYAVIDAAEFGNVIALWEGFPVYPPLLKLSLTFTGLCNDLNSATSVKLSGSLVYGLDDTSGPCLDYKIQLEKLQNELASLKADYSVLSEEYDSLNEKLAYHESLNRKLTDQIASARKEVNKTNPQSILQLKKLHAYLKILLNKRTK